MKKERRGIQSIEVGGQLLVALVEEGAPMNLRDLAHKAGMTSAKAHPYLVSFGNIGLIRQDPVSGHYELGQFALQMGLISLQHLDPVRIAIPEVAELSNAIGHTVALAVMGSHGPTIIHLKESRLPIHVRMRTGTVMSVVNTATGQIFAAYLPPMTVEKLIASELGSQTEGERLQRKLSKQDLETMLAEIRLHGMSRIIGEPVDGINVMSVPVFDHTGNIVLAVTVIGPMGSLDPDWDGAAATHMKQAARRISQQLGQRG